MATRYVVGDPVVLTNTFKVGGTETDPTTVSLAVTDPSGNTDTYTYGAGEITKSSTGVYTKTITTDEAGSWKYKWTGTGTAADVADGTFRVFAAADGQLYAPLDLIKSHLSVSDTDDDAHIQLAADTAKQAIEDFCGRFFYSTTQTRYYTAAGHLYVLVDDLVSVDTIKTDTTGNGTYDTTWTSGDYHLEPYNAATDGRPYTSISVAPDGDNSFPTTRKAVEVVGTFGWPTIPTPVENAAVIQAALFFKRATEGAAPIVTMNGTTLPSSRYLDRQVQMLLGPYRRIAVA